jgi:hypothetical protein
MNTANRSQQSQRKLSKNPYRESDTAHYCRLLEPSTISYSDWRDCVTKLGYAMTDERSSVSWNRPILPISAGYTYFGQFVDHDLTKDKSSLDEVLKTEPHELLNRQSAKLDLSHLYGEGPNGSANLYERGSYLKVGKPGKRGLPFDIPIDPVTSRWVLADDRSGENWILRQITAVFGRLHNFAIDHCDPAIAHLPEFERARLQTTWQFQRLVSGDYLRTVLDPEVYTTVFENGTYTPVFEWSNFSIPIEFSVGAMRFGHSMVRPTYMFSVGHEKKLADIFGFVDDQRGAIPDECEIDWGFFFQGAVAPPVGSAPPHMGDPVTARPIDTQLTDPLHDLPASLVRLFNSSAKREADPPQLPIRTLRRGTALRLPSGRVAAEAFGISPLTEDELIRNSKGEITESGIVLKKCKMIPTVPLWYYILRESEVWHNGNRLGPTGSYIIAETIHAALRYDKDSYLNHAAMKGRWPLWRFADGDRMIRNLGELFREAVKF